MVRGSGSWIATGLLGLALVVSSNVPAAASWQQPVLSASSDHRGWSPVRVTPLFHEGRRWVPGETRAVTVWLQDRSGRPGQLDLGLSEVSDPVRTVSRDTASRSGVVITARVDGQAQPATLEHRVRVSSSGAPVRVDVRATLPLEARNTTQRVRTGFTLRATLVDDPALGSTLPGLSQQVGGAPYVPFGMLLTLLALLVTVRAVIRGRRNLLRHLEPTA